MQLVWLVFDQANTMAKMPGTPRECSGITSIWVIN